MTGRVQLRKCDQNRADCRAIEIRKDGLYCKALNKTKFKNRVCPFYKTDMQFMREERLIMKGTPGMTPIVKRVSE